MSNVVPTGLTADDFEIMLNGTGSRRSRTFKAPRPSGRNTWPFVQVYCRADQRDAAIMSKRSEQFWRTTESLAFRRLYRRAFKPADLVQA